MELWFTDWEDNRHGPLSVVAKDTDCWYIHYEVKPQILIAIPEILTTTKIIKDEEIIPSVYEYV